MSRKFYSFLLAAVLLLFIQVVKSEEAAAEQRLPQFKIYQLPCGDEIGDVYVFFSPDGKRYLMDGGNQKNYERTLKPELARLGVTKLDGLIISHLHDDHMYAAYKMICDMDNNHIEVKEILWQPNVSWEAFQTDEPKWFKGQQILYWNFKKEAQKRHIPMRTLKNGDKIDFGSGAYGEILWGVDSTYTGKNYMNNQSLLMKFHYGKNTILFTGDMGFEEEYNSLRTGVDFKADVLKAPHHGGGGSNSYVLMKGCAPKFAIVPRPEWLSKTPTGLAVDERYRSCGIKLFQSWQYPRLCLISDGIDILPYQDDERLLK